MISCCWGLLWDVWQPPWPPPPRGQRLPRPPPSRGDEKRLQTFAAGQEATVKTRHGTTDWFQIGKGVHQDCLLSLCLFNLYGVCDANSWQGPKRAAPVETP